MYAERAELASRCCDCRGCDKCKGFVSGCHCDETPFRLTDPEITGTITEPHLFGTPPAELLYEDEFPF
jgi:hypothetical protein